jgi:hypothetical protein
MYRTAAFILPLAALFYTYAYLSRRGRSPCTLASLALRWVVGSETMTTPGGTGTPWTASQQSLRARRTGFYHGVGAPSRQGSGPFALPRPDALSPLLNNPVFAAHNTRRYGHPSSGAPGPIGVGGCRLSPRRELLLYRTMRSLGKREGRGCNAPALEPSPASLDGSLILLR